MIRRCYRGRLRCGLPLLLKLVGSILVTWIAFSLLNALRVVRYNARFPIARASNADDQVYPGHVYRRRLNASDANSDQRIPRIIHQTWKSYQKIPETFRKWMSSWIRRNPDWEYWFWTDDEIRTLIASSYPDYLDLYDSYPTQAYRIDVFRYFVLYEHGGLYVDLDMECIRPFDDFLMAIGHSLSLSSDCILSQEPLEHAIFLAPYGVPLVSNALMACRPRHPFFESVISGLAWYWTRNDVLRATGPYMLTVVYRDYSSTRSCIGRFLELVGLAAGPSSEGRRQSPVILADPSDFHPSPDSSMVDYMRQACVETRQRSVADVVRGFLFSADSPSSSSSSVVNVDIICDRLSAYDFGRSGSATAFSDHHWTHSWVGRRNDPWGLLNEQLAMFSVEELFDDRLRLRTTVVDAQPAIRY